MLLGTPNLAQSSAAVPVMYTTGKAGSRSLAMRARSYPGHGTPDVHVGHQRPETGDLAMEKCDRVLSRGKDFREKAAFAQCVLEHLPHQEVVLRNQNLERFVQKTVLTRDSTRPRALLFL